MIALIKTAYRIFWTAVVLWIGFGLFLLASSTEPKFIWVFIGYFLAPVSLLCFILAPIYEGLHPVLHADDKD